jgi:hypothetical protein
MLQARKPYLLNLPCTDRTCKYFSLDLTSVVFLLVLVPLTPHNRSNFQNAVVQEKKKQDG